MPQPRQTDVSGVPVKPTCALFSVACYLQLLTGYEALKYLLQVYCFGLGWLSDGILRLVWPGTNLNPPSPAASVALIPPTALS